MAVFNTQALTSRLGLVRLAAALCTCVAFSLVIHASAWWGQQGSWCLFAWCFSFAVTVLVLLLELSGTAGRIPVSWRNAPVACAALCGLLCLSASVIYPLYFLGGVVPAQSQGEAYSHGVAATVFSCLATVAYTAEVSLCRGRPGETVGYMATIPGLLKVVEAFSACVIFAFVSGTAYHVYPALQWCLAVYCLCFIMAAIVIVLCVTELTGYLPSPIHKSLGLYALLCALLYASALVLWPLYCFSPHYGNARRSNSCGSNHVCPWDAMLTVAILTGFNLLVYVADLVYSTRLVFITSS
ncbi:myeloid-associated differentiation marker [Amblyraja radiata]|uniref:myeloid-associated differentiation marker n=1 Tax=Amblyraja radiata TaxID=386614 RepID=UPI0014036262|nr:myeloid-associated differentiation marker [Amblyraja radiata]XP_032872704.1 myeloid-associated differentiation marker [Amblyraja radiata]XP_032872705.1 myeloid-associated differentiation marker [Amblyraja radiata]XP_032872706.1 myeloid-associated differentiation marker [Amblyraja radiata]XP_032872707.1 myeloid-associated differentiation marker [Amblyraja radiata]